MPDLHALSTEIRRLEERLLEPRTRRSVHELNRLLADEFTEFGSSGRRYDKPRVIAGLAADPVSPGSLTDFQLSLLAPGLALATYRLIAPHQSGRPPAQSLRSSIWKHLGGRWQLLFHQGTPISIG